MRELNRRGDIGRNHDTAATPEPGREASARPTAMPRIPKKNGSFRSVDMHDRLPPLTGIDMRIVQYERLIVDMHGQQMMACVLCNKSKCY